MKLEVRKKKRYVDFKPTETVHSFGKLKWFWKFLKKNEERV
jgi:hypothetical protein